MYSFNETIGKIKESAKELTEKIRIYINRGRNSAYAKDVKSTWGEFKTRILTYGISLFVVCGICLGANALELRLGYEVIVDGETVGMVTDEAIVNDALSSVKDDVLKYMGSSEYEKEPVFITRIVQQKNVTSKEAIKEQLLKNIDTMVSCYGVYVDGEAVLGVTSEEAAKWILEKYKEESVRPEIAAVSKIDFVEEVETRKGHVHISLLKTPDEALELLRGADNIQPVSYTAENDETLWEISKNNNISVERLLALNKNIGNKVKKGDMVTLEQAVPVISVRAVRSEEYVEEVPFEVEKIEDAEIYEGRCVIEKKGEKGEAKVLARVTEVNGVESKREIIKSDVIKEAHTQVEKVGTKECPPTTGSGSFVNPSYGSLSSRYGLRWDRSHNGIDISGQHGSDIMAADGGLVTYASWMDGYGNYVVINHENGYETAYGHCSELLVQVGQRVIKGEVIAKMGSTGRSTGTHLHFEVKKDGVFQNPLEYVGY